MAAVPERLGLFSDAGWQPFWRSGRARLCRLPASGRGLRWASTWARDCVWGVEVWRSTCGPSTSARERAAA